MKLITMLMIAALTILSVSLFAQTNAKSKKAKTKAKTEAVQYTCPMHPEVISNKPGKCPKCGMNLVKVKSKTTAQKMVYTCPMHPDVISDKLGSCPKCGMTLVKKSS